MDDLPQGIYERVISKALEKPLDELVANPDYSVDSVDIDGAESTTVLSRYVQSVLEKGLKSLIAKTNAELDLTGNELKTATLKAEIDACNRIIQMLSDASNDKDLLDWKIGESGKQLRHIWKEKKTPVFSRPRTSLSISELFTGGHQDLALSDELCREIESSDEVFLLVSFIKISGLNLIMDSLENFVKSDEHKLRILTTTYMGASDAIAIDRLSKLPNTKIKVSYDSKSTRLHAKAYIFKRRSKFSTVYIGSSNLSRAAISEGLEWNIKLTNQDAPQVIDAAMATFETYWDSPDFEEYNPTEEGIARLRAALKEERSPSESKPHFMFELQPYPFQKELLEQLKAEREIHGRYRNLIVAATGTGKTMLSAFDYKEFIKNNPDSDNSLLYIAQSKEILEKSLATYRAVLRNPAFGDIYTGDNTPADNKHVFMTISLFAKRRFDLHQDPRYYNYIVVDEVHHGAAESYQAIFNHYKPDILLGMTATPERSDEKSILPYFDNRIAVEIRLPEAINREFLVPFHYFGVLDSADLKSVRFEKGKFNIEDLEKEYNNRIRAQLVVDKVNYYWPYIDKIRCIGFCVSIAHAEFMADFFNKCGYNARAVHGNTPRELREQTPSDFGSGKINFIFTVDLYNEGVDIPEINTILFLRPTESLTIFIQQLGRGLRTCEGKSELLVLDFIGQFKANYRMYEKKIKYLTSDSKKGVKKQITDGFSGLPAGCNIKLEEKVPKIILDSIPKSRKKKELLESITSFLELNNRLPTFREFIENTEESLQSFFEAYTFSELCFTVLDKSFDDKTDKMFRNGLKKLCYIDSAHWIDEILHILNEGNSHSTDRTPLFKSMFYYSFLNDPPSASQYKTFEGFIDFVKEQDSYKNEILSVLNIRKDELRFIGDAPIVDYSCGLDIHCKYFRNQIFAGLGINTESYKNPSREGVYYSKDLNTDILLITLNKSEKDFSPTTRYADYPISENRFHWQTQSKTTDQSKDGLRYINQKENGSTVLLFVREDATKGSFAMPFMFLGKGTIEHYENNKPMDIIWTMESNIPAQILAYSPVRS